MIYYRFFVPIDVITHATRIRLIFLPISAFYIERFVTAPKGKFLEKRKCRILCRLADPMVLNVVTLMVGGLTLLLIPLTVKDICPKGPHDTVACGCYVPLRTLLYCLVFIHTVASGKLEATTYRFLY